eukprot:PhF_6_TR616/c0_g1_i2/m.803
MAETDALQRVAQERAAEERRQLLLKVESLKNTGNEYFNKKDNQRAIETYTMAITIAPHDAENLHVIYSNRSVAYLQTGNVTKAIDDARRCVALRPDFGRGYVRLGKALVEAGEVKEAIEVYRKCLEIDNSNTSAREEVHFLTEGGCLVDMSATPASTLKWKSIGLMRGNFFAAALDSLTEAVALDPSNVEVLFLRSKVNLILGNVGDALEDANQCTMFSPKWCKGYEALGAVQEALAAAQQDPSKAYGTWKHAVTAYRSALSFSPSAEFTESCSIKLRHAEEKERDFARQAEEAGRGALVLSEGTGSHSGALTLTEDFESMGDAKYIANIYNGALGFYKQAIKKEKPTPQLHVKCAICWAHMKKLEKAVRECDDALTIQPDYLRGLWYKGQYLRDLKKYDDAIQTYTLGLVYQQQGKRAENDKLPDEENIGSFLDAIQHVQTMKMVHDYANVEDAVVHDDPRAKRTKLTK